MEQQQDPVKAAFVQQMADKHNRREPVSWGYIVAGGLLILVFAYVSLKQSGPSFQQASVLGSGSSPQAQTQNQAVQSVRGKVGWYDSGEWSSVQNPDGSGTVVIMSGNFLWLVADNGTIYNINGLAKTITPDFPMTTEVTPDDVFAVTKH